MARGTRQGAGADTVPPEPALLPGGQVHQAEQPDAEADHVDAAVAGEVSPVACCGRRPDRLARLVEDVDEQKDQDAGRRTDEEGAGALACGPDPGHGQTEEDGEPRDGAETDN